MRKRNSKTNQKKAELETSSVMSVNFQSLENLKQVNLSSLWVPEEVLPLV